MRFCLALLTVLMSQIVFAQGSQKWLMEVFQVDSHCNAGNQCDVCFNFNTLDEAARKGPQDKTRTDKVCSAPFVMGPTMKGSVEFLKQFPHEVDGRRLADGFNFPEFVATQKEGFCGNGQRAIEEMEAKIKAYRSGLQAFQCQDTGPRKAGARSH